MLQTDEVLGIIPARMASTRFPGKPLVMIGDVPMVIRVYRQAAMVLPNLVIASGDPQIEAAARLYGAGFVPTVQDHVSGTSRCIEAAGRHMESCGKTFKYILNIQGDEAMVTPEAIAGLAADISASGSSISTLIRPETDEEGYHNPNRVKVVTTSDGFALYFSRSPLPFYRNSGTAWHSHIGMYAFTREALQQIEKLGPGRLEMAESLEQLRWLENGLRIHCCETGYPGFGIDTPEDLALIAGSGLI